MSFGGPGTRDGVKAAEIIQFPVQAGLHLRRRAQLRASSFVKTYIFTLCVMMDLTDSRFHPKIFTWKLFLTMLT